MEKTNCMQCWYGGSFRPKSCTATCDNENNEERYLNPNSEWSGDKYIVKTLNEEADKDCDLFIPMADYNDIEVEPQTTFNIHVKCPICGHEQIEDDKSGEGSELFECEECGGKFGAGWNIY